MLQLWMSEWYKLWKSKFAWFLLAGPSVGLAGGIGAGTAVGDSAGINEWYYPLLVMNMIYALLFLPLITGVLAGLICRYEHQAGGWKQLLALPVTRGRVYIAKYAVLMTVVLIMQLLYLAAVYAVGMIQGFTEPFPFLIVWKCIFGGWVATFPLVALQLWMSVMWKSFAAPFAVNVVFTLPTILAINSEKFGPYYPWAQPFSMMYVSDVRGGDVFFVPWEQLITVVGGSFVLFFLAGFMYFRRKAV